jgi:hypothetical protein
MPMTVRVLGSIALIVALATRALLVHADPDGYDERLVRAVAAKERALDADDTAHWREVLNAFQAADAVRDTPEVLYEIGYAAQRLKLIELAVEAFAGALELGLTGPARDKAAEYVTAHSQETATLNVVGPSGATLSVNGVPRATLPLRRPLVVLAGHVSLEAAAGGEHQSRELDLAPGARETADLTPAPAPIEAPAPAAPAPANDVPPARPGAPVATGPLATEPARGRGRAGPWVLIGTGAAFTVVGAILIPVSNGRIDQGRNALDDSCQIRNGPDACYRANAGYEQAAQDQVDSIATYKAVRTGAWIGVGAGAVALVTGIALAAHAPAARPAPTSRSSSEWHLDVVPFPAPALSVRRTF